jgi:Protein of unknown function (DUF642)/PEP-CTERM motif
MDMELLAIRCQPVKSWAVKGRCVDKAGKEVLHFGGAMREYVARFARSVFSAIVILTRRSAASSELLVRSFVFAAMIILGIVPGLVSTGRAATITNGSFEDIQISGNSCVETSSICSTMPADWPGWTHTGDAGDGLLWHAGPVCCGGTSTGKAGDGNQWVTLGGGISASGSSAWSQTISGLNIGQSYVISFMMAAEANFETGGRSLDVSLTSGSSTPSQTFTATPVSAFWQSWESKEYTFVPTATSATLQFSVTNATDDVGLDNVSIAAAPEPASLLLLGSGLIVLAGRLRSRKLRR